MPEKQFDNVSEQRVIFVARTLVTRNKLYVKISHRIWHKSILVVRPYRTIL